MPTNYPDALDQFTNPTAGTSQNTVRTHSQQHSDLNDAMVAVQTTIGTNAQPGLVRTADLASADAGKGVALVHDAARASDLASTAAGKGSDLMAFRDVLAPSFLKTISDIKAGEPVSVFRNIAPAKYSGIRDQTNTDDLRANFSDLLAAMSTAKHGELIVPAGRYNLGAGLEVPASVHVRGANQRATFLRFTAATNGLTMLANSRASELTVDGGSTALTGFLSSANYVRLNNVTAQNMAFHGFAWQNNAHCKAYGIEAISCQQRGFLIDPGAQHHQIIGYHAIGCTQSALLIGHNTRHCIVRGVHALDTGNAAIWIHNEAYRNEISGLVIRGTTAAASTPAIILAANAYGNVVGGFSIESYEIGILLRGSVVDTGFTAGHTRLNVIGHGQMIGTGSGVAGSAAIKFDSLDSGATKAQGNRIAHIIATDYATGVADTSGNSAINNNLHDIDLSTNIATPWSVPNGAGNRAHDIRGYTPQGFLSSPPAVAASGTAVSNPYPFAVMVAVKGMPADGNVNINGAGVDATAAPNGGNGAWAVGPGQAITLIYATGTPTWRWFGT